MIVRRALLAVLVAIAVAFGGSGRALADAPVPKALDGIDIQDRTGASVPRDVKLRDQNGAEFTLGDRLRGDKPLVLLLAYYECPMLCSLVINGLTQGMKDLSFTAGDQYRVLVVSFDPRDKVAIAKQKREAYLGAYGRKVEGDGWDFAIGDAAEVRRLADAVGFGYRWDEKTEQFAHAAGAFVLTPDGRLSRTLYGISFPSKNLSLALREAAAGTVGGVVDRVLLFCFHYDPMAGSYVLATRRLMMAAGVLTVLVLSVWLLRLWRVERSRAPRAAEQRS